MVAVDQDCANGLAVSGGSPQHLRRCKHATRAGADDRDGWPGNSCAVSRAAHGSLSLDQHRRPVRAEISKSVEIVNKLPERGRGVKREVGRGRPGDVRVVLP
jgi:hypothetical protein